MIEHAPSLASVLDFTGKVAIVTGGTKGIGRGIAARFLEAGADVIVCGRSQPDELPSRAARSAHFVAADVRDVEQIQNVIRAATERFGRLDTLVNNAGGAPPADAATASPRFSDKIVQLNLLAPLNFAQQANLVMREQKLGGTIVNIASVSGLRPSPGTAAYGAAKAGLASLHPEPGGRMGPEGAGQHRRGGTDPHRAGPPSLRRRGGDRGGCRDRAVGPPRRARRRR